MTVGLLRAEWIKLRRLRVTWLLPILPMVLMLVGGMRIAYAVAETSRTTASPWTKPSCSRLLFRSCC